MNGCSIINVFTQNGLTNSGGGGGVSDGKVKVDILATADFLGATGSTGALRVDSTFNYTDGGNFVTLGLADNSVTTAKITDANVTYAKVQNVGAVSLLGNPTGSAISVSEITLGSGLSFNSTTLEVAIGTDVQAWNSKLDTFSALADGSNGQVLQTNGAGAYSWVTILGSGNVSSALDFTTDDRLVLVDFTSGAKNVKQSSVLLSDVSLNSDNLSNLANASTSRTNLGVAIGTDVQGYDATLGSIATAGMSLGALFIGTGPNTVAQLSIGSNGQVLTSNGTTALWQTSSASAPTWTTATASTATSASIDLSTNYYVEVDGDADFNLTTIDTTDLQTGIRHLLVFIPSGATRTVTNGLTSMDNFGGAIPVTTSERLILEIFKDNTGNVNIAGSVVS